MYWKPVVALLLVGVAKPAPLDINYLPPPGSSTSDTSGSTGGIGFPHGGKKSFGGNGGNSGGREGSGGVGGPGVIGTGGYGGINGFKSMSEEDTNAYDGGSSSTGVYGSTSGPIIPIISYENNPNQGDGSYSWSYETGNDIKAQEKGFLNANVPEGPGESAKGSFSYIAPDGQQISVYYTADENGFAPEGSHLPTPPPIPQEILESLRKNAADEAAGIFDDGSYRGEADGYDEAVGYGGSQASGADSYEGVGYGVVEESSTGRYRGASSAGESGGYQYDAPGYSYPKPS